MVLSTISKAATKAVIGCAVLLGLSLTGCGGGGGGSTVPSSPSAPVVSTVTNPAVVAKNAYVCDPLNETIDVYAADINGLAALTGSYPVGPASQTVVGVAVDGAGNIYVAENEGLSNSLVVVYAPGSYTPSRTITMPTGSTIIGGYGADGGPVTVDTAGNIYIATSNGATTTNDSIYVFGPTANGAATPIRTIFGSLTQLQNPTQFALDAAGDLYAVMANSDILPPILVMYPAGSSGNVAPTLITSSQYTPDAVALDTAGNIYITSGGTATSVIATAIYEFPAGSTAGAAPIRTITGANVLLDRGTFLQVDAAGNIFVAGFFGISSYQSGESIFVYGAKASGDVAPGSTLITYQSAESCFALK